MPVGEKKSPPAQSCRCVKTNAGTSKFLFFFCLFGVADVAVRCQPLRDPIVIGSWREGNTHTQTTATEIIIIIKTMRKQTAG
jgi:hypothetical protein